MVGLWIGLILAVLVSAGLYVFEQEESTRLRQELDTARAERDQALARQVPVLPVHHISRRLTAEDIAGELARVQGLTR